MGSNLTGTRTQDQEMCRDKLACTHTQVSGDTRKKPYRLSTFLRFPASTTPVLPAAFARSGFFNTGYKGRVKCFSCGISVENWIRGVDVSNKKWHRTRERDRVKCWYCNGGLQNWDYGDDPWTEHVKWFPSCHYLLRVKGPAFVNGVVAQYPEINRRVPAVILGSPSPLHSENISPSRGLDIPSVSSSGPSKQYGDGCDPVTSHVTPELLHQECSIKSPKERLPTGINNLVNERLFCPDKMGRVKCRCRSGGLQNWGNGVGPCICAVTVEELEVHMSDKKWHSEVVELASLLTLALYKEKLANWPTE